MDKSAWRREDQTMGVGVRRAEVCVRLESERLSRLSFRGFMRYLPFLYQHASTQCGVIVPPRM